MTFSQTIQEANARGTRDLVRYPGVGELFKRADELRPKMATDLEDTVGKERTFRTYLLYSLLSYADYLVSNRRDAGRNAREAVRGCQTL